MSFECDATNGLASAIEAAIAQHGGLRPAGRALGIDPSYLSRLQHGEKLNPSDETLAALGLERVTIYRVKGENP